MAKPVKKLRFETLEDYIKHHQELASSHWFYLEKKTRGRPPDYRKIDAEGGVALCATSFSSRIAFTRIALEELESFVPMEQRENVHSVTVAPSQYAVPMSDAATFDLRGLKIVTARVLSGLDYIGILEGAYYPAWIGGVPHVSFHIHALAFGVSERELQVRKAKFNHRHHSIMPGWQAMHSEPIPSAEAAPKLMYALKMPCRAYKPFALRKEQVDPATGVFEKVTTGNFAQRKDALRPGEVVKMMDAFSDRYLDQLIIGGGRGVQVKQRVTDRALEGFELYQYRQSRTGNQKKT